MNFRTIVHLAILGCTAWLGTPAFAAIEFDQNVTPEVIFGSGNANGGFTTDRSYGVELGLRAKVRFPVPMNVFNSNGDGTYNHLAGNDAGRPLWSFEWSVNTNFDNSSNWLLDDLLYQLRIDTDPSVGTNFTTFDPINVPLADHAIGDNSTASNAGVEATSVADYANLIANNNVAQNSWRMDFFFPAFGPAFDPNVDATYEFELAAFDGGELVAETMMTVIVGQGGAVPEPASVLAWAGLAICLGVGKWRKNR